MASHDGGFGDGAEAFEVRMRQRVIEREVYRALVVRNVDARLVPTGRKARAHTHHVCDGAKGCWKYATLTCPSLPKPPRPAATPKLRRSSARRFLLPAS
jgi:hypothetical protein